MMNRALIQALAVTCLLWPGKAHAFMEKTRLLDMRAGTALSRSVNSLQNEGYELSDGTPILFGDWYRPDWPDIQIKFLTAVRDNFAITWGFGTGEKGGQYSIQPSLHLGFVAVHDISPSQSLTFSVSGMIGGHLSEQPCTANYGALGGTQLVNCRLAATTMRPADTLDLLMDESPSNQVQHFPALSIQILNDYWHRELLFRHRIQLTSELGVFGARTGGG